MQHSLASEQVDAIRAELEQARHDAVALGLEDEFPQLVRANAQYLLPPICSCTGAFAKSRVSRWGLVPIRKCSRLIERAGCPG